MLARFLLDWNQAGAVALAAVVNAFPLTIVLTGTAWLSMLCPKRWTAASRYWVWCFVLLSLVLTPALNPVLANHRLLKQAPRFETVAVHLTRSSKLPSAPAVGIVSGLNARTTEAAVVWSIAGVLLLIWTAVLAWQLARLMLSFLSTRRLKRAAGAPSVELEANFRTRLAACGSRRPVELKLSDRIATPAVTGYLRPAILLPTSVCDVLSEDELDQIFSHELAHVRRYDDWAISAQRLLEAILLLHPIAHLVLKRIELEREIACDDWVLSTGQPNAYASCLTKLAEFCAIGRPPRFTTAAIESRSQLSRRIEMLLDGTRAITTRASLRRVSAVAALLCTLAFIGLRFPSMMAYPAPQSAAPATQVAPAAPTTPPGPSAPPAPSEAPAPPPSPISSTPPEAPEAPVLPAAPPAQQTAPVHRPQSDIGSIIVYSEDGHGFGYTISDSDNIYVKPTSRNSGTIEFRRGGKSYVIRDRATVRAAQDLLRPQELLGQRQAKLGAEQSKIGELQAKLATEQADTATRQLDHAAIERLTQEAKRLQDEVAKTDMKELMKSTSNAQQELGELQSKLAKLQAEIASSESGMMFAQDELAQKLSKLGQEQSRFAEMESKLAQDQNRQAEQVQQKLKDLIERAIQDGLAQPVQ